MSDTSGSTEVSMRVNTRFAALAYSNYRLFFSGQLIASIGQWMQSLAMAWLVVQDLHGTAFQLGLLQLFRFGPIILFGIPAGIIADRHSKRLLLLITQAIFLAAAITMTLTVLSGSVRLWHVYTISLILGITNSLGMPTRQAIVPDLVPPHALKNAIAMNSAMFNVGRILGPSLAGVLLAKWGVVACFAADAVGYLGPITAYLLIKGGDRPAVSAGNPVDQLKEGLSFIRRTPAVFFPILIMGVVATASMNTNVWLPLIATQSLQASEQTYGTLFALMGVGSLAGALSVAFSISAPTVKRMAAASMVYGIVLLVIAWMTSVPLQAWLIGVTLGVLGFFMPNVLATANTIVQANSPNELRGRVMAVYSTIFLGTAPIGGMIFGYLAGRVRVEGSMFIGGTIATITAAIFLARGKALARALTPAAPQEIVGEHS